MNESEILRRLRAAVKTALDYGELTELEQLLYESDVTRLAQGLIDNSPDLTQRMFNLKN